MKWLASIPLVLVLAACASNDTPAPTRPIVIDSQPIERPNLTLPPVDRYNAQDVEWIIVTPENAENVFARLDREGRAVSLFAVTEQGYENLAVNIREALRVIQQQQAVIDSYQEYYIRVDSQIAQHNAKQ